MRHLLRDDQHPIVGSCANEIIDVKVASYPRHAKSVSRAIACPHEAVIPIFSRPAILSALTRSPNAPMDQLKRLNLILRTNRRPFHNRSALSWAQRHSISWRRQPAALNPRERLIVCEKGKVFIRQQK
jgi:hypothetical protein